MDLSRWKKHPFKVSTLELDPLNPRIPALVDAPSQRDIVAHMVEHEEVHDLAKSIADFGGLYPSESLIAVEEDGKKVVLEGNRRLAALKLLNSPDLAPDNMKSKFRSLIHNLPKQAIESAEVVVAPSRAAAARLIVARHTGEVVKRWSRAQQAKYIRTLVQAGQTIEEVAAEVQMAPGDIRNFLRTDTMIQLAHVTPVTPAVREAIDDKGFSVTTLERLIQSTPGQKFLGIKFDPDGNAVGEYDSEEFKKAYARVLTDIAEEKISTRKLNTTEDIEAYLCKMGKDKPNRAKKATWTSTQLMSGKTDAAKAALKAAKKPKPAPSSEREEPYFIPRAFRCRIKQPKIREVFGELRRLKLSEFPNGCAVLGRIFVELLVGHYLERTGKDKPLLEKAKREGKPADWSPTLRQMMRAVLNDTTITLKPQVRRALDRMANDDDSLISLDHIDQFVHSRYIAPSERDLRHLWTSVEPLLDLFMTELVALAVAKPKS
jgi:ParB-like chromosome segregation protein Spo0J